MAFYKNQLFKNISIVALSYAFAQLILLLATPILTRLYSPVYFATFGYVISVANTFLTIASLRYEYAIPLLRSKRAIFLFTKLCNQLVWMTSGLILCGALVVQQYFHENALNIFLLIMCFAVLVLQGLLQVYTMPLLAQGKVLQVSYGKIIQNIGMIVIQISIALIWHSSAALLILGLFFGLFINLQYYRWALAVRRQHLKLTKRRVTFFLKRYYQFPLYSSWAGFIDSASTLMPVFLIGPWYGAKALGLYFLVFRVFTSPVGLLAKSVSQVMIKEFADRVKARQEVFGSFIKISGILLLIALGYGGLMFGLSYWAGFLFGKDWLSAGPIIRILAPVIAIVLCVSPLTVIFGILQKNKIASLWQVLYLVATIVVMFSNRSQTFLHMLFYLACIWFLLYVLYWLTMCKVILTHKRALCVVSSA